VITEPSEVAKQPTMMLVHPWKAFSNSGVSCFSGEENTQKTSIKTNAEKIMVHRACLFESKRVMGYLLFSLLTIIINGKMNGCQCL
jgi:hypothetical protein